MKTTIWVKTSFVGFHCWPDAPDEIAYLRNLHRHTFNVQVNVGVSHADRDVEFHLLKKDVEKQLARVQDQLAFKKSMSCEMIAEALYMLLRTAYPSIRSIGVDEDGECGAVLVF